jgi:hypothetical protein
MQIRLKIVVTVIRGVGQLKQSKAKSTYLDGCMVRSVILSDFDLDGAVRDLHARVWEMLIRRDQHFGSVQDFTVPSGHVMVPLRSHSARQFP